MSDPLAQMVALLEPSASLSKLVVAEDAWSVERTGDDSPFYCAIRDGCCRLTIEGRAPIVLAKGDFALLPVTTACTVSSLEPPPPGTTLIHCEVSPGIFRVGRRGDGPIFQALVGHCAFRSKDAALLVSLLPDLVLVRGQRRLTTLVELVDDELHSDRPGRETVLGRLLEVLLIEALRAAAGGSAPAGLLRGLADPRLTLALRQIHADPSRAWSVVELARHAGLSRSTFFARFRREVGVTPMDYLLAWRMALARDLLGREKISVGRVAERVGYSSASTFSVAFTRQLGVPPSSVARGQKPAQPLVTTGGVGSGRFSPRARQSVST